MTTTHLSSQEESHPLMHQIGGLQTLVMAVALGVAGEPTLAPLGHGPVTPGEHEIKHLPMDKRAFVGIQWRGSRIALMMENQQFTRTVREEEKNKRATRHQKTIRWLYNVLTYQQSL